MSEPKPQYLAVREPESFGEIERLGSVPAEKRCSVCRQTKPASEFYRKKGRSDGLFAYCKPCARVKVAAWRERQGPEGLSAKEKAWRARHNEARRRRRAADPAQAFAEQLRRNHRLTPEDYAVMDAAQGGRCAICGEKPSGLRLHIDHDHATGRRRGLLCGSCNKGLGLFRDDPDRLLRAVWYLGIIKLAEEIGA